MKTTNVIVSLLLVVAGLSCSSTTTPPGELCDPAKAATVPVVLRIKHISPHGGSETHHSTVLVLNVIKNDTKHTFAGEIPIWYAGTERYYPPAGVCTIYLEPSRGEKPSEIRWRLKQGVNIELGYSHTEKE